MLCRLHGISSVFLTVFISTHLGFPDFGPYFILDSDCLTQEAAIIID